MAWQGYAEYEATWENAEVFEIKYPSFVVEQT